MRILVATDLSESADVAILHAHALLAGDGTLAACHVLPNLQQVVPLFPQRNQQGVLDIAALTVRAGDLVRERVAALTGRGPDNFEVFIDEGVDYTAIVERATAWKADLIVVGSHGLTGLKRILLGSVAERVARLSPCPVLIARAGPTTGPVVAATDLSDPSLPAILAGRAQAMRKRASLVVMHVVDAGPALPMVAGVPFGMVPMAYTKEVFDDIKDAAKTMLSAALKSAGAEGEALIMAGDPTACIVNEAEKRQAQLIVVGTHGRTGLMQIALGSVAEKVIRAAPCSVMVVRLADGA